MFIFHCDKTVHGLLLTELHMFAHRHSLPGRHKSHFCFKCRIYVQVCEQCGNCSIYDLRLNVRSCVTTEPSTPDGCKLSVLLVTDDVCVCLCSPSLHHCKQFLLVCVNVCTCVFVLIPVLAQWSHTLLHTHTAVCLPVGYSSSLGEFVSLPG